MGEMMEKIKLCPFCGNKKATLMSGTCRDWGKYWYVKCEDCGGIGPSFYESINKDVDPAEECNLIINAWEKAIEGWNKRVK